MMTLILEFERKLIFYKPGILRYAMRQAAPQFSGLQSGTQRRELLSQSLKRGWEEARAELAALQRLQAFVPQDCAGLLRDHLVVGETTLPNEAPATALAPRWLQRGSAMHRSLPHPLVVSSQALPCEVPPLSPSPLSPAELAQAYRSWRFGPGRTVSRDHLTGRAER